MQSGRRDGRTKEIFTVAMVLQCIVQRNINEYSSFASGSVVGYEFVYDDAKCLSCLRKF